MAGRRQLLRAAGLAALAQGASGLVQPTAVAQVRSAAALVTPLAPEAAARDEDYWATVQQAFSCDRNWIDLSGGGVSAVPRAVMEASLHHLERGQSAMGASYDTFRTGRVAARRRLAKLLNCSFEEVLVTRNTTESLNTVIFGIELRPGDEIVTTNQDYPTMIAAWKQRERREGVKLRIIDTPIVPKSQAELFEAFERAITPRTKVLMACHVLCDTG